MNVNAKGDDFDELTVLENAVLYGEIGLVKILLDTGVDVNTISRETEYQTALEMAVGLRFNTGPQNGEIVQVLLTTGADVNIPKENRARQYSNLLPRAMGKLISILLREGIDINSC